MSLVPTREEQAWADGYARSSNSSGPIIDHLAKRLREVEAERDKAKLLLAEAVEALKHAGIEYSESSGGFVHVGTPRGQT